MADAPTARIEYDEFGLFHENAEEFGLPYESPPVVRRERVELDDGRALSALVWGVAERFDRAGLWDVIGALTMPLMLVRGMAAGSVVTDDDEAELLRRQPGARVERVDGAGHSVQGDKPIELAALLEDFVP